MRESKTGLCIAYNREDGSIYVRAICHITADIHVNGNALVCDECGRIYSSSTISECVHEWATNWNILTDGSHSSALLRWAAAWAGIEEEKLTVTVEP